jgi:hypothetical protein
MDSFTKTESNVATNSSEQLASPLDGATFQAAEAHQWVQDFREFGGRSSDFF